jgi:O-antigen/teichoic acid export membrane protein
MSINVTKSDVRWSYISLLLFNGINVILLPFILSYLSTPEVGLWYTFTAISGLVVILDFGFMTTLSRNVTFVWSGAKDITSSGYKETAENQSTNYRLFARLFKTTKLIYLCLGLVILVLLLTVGSYYVYFVSKSDIPVSTILYSWFIYAIAIFLNMRYAYWNAILKGIGAIKQNQQLLIVTKLSQLILTVLGLVNGYGIIGVAGAYFFSIVINRILANIMFYSYQNNKKHVKPLLSESMNKDEYVTILKKLLPNTYKQGLISLSNYINLRSTTILCSAFFSLNVAASIGLVLQITSLITVLANTFFNTYLPQFSSYRVKNEHKLLNNTFWKAILINYFIIFIAYILLLVFSDFVLELIGSNVDMLPLPYTLVIMLYIFLYNNHTIFASMIATKNELPHYKAFILSAIGVISLQLILLYTLEPTLWSLILPILFMQLLYNNWKWPKILLMELGTNATKNGFFEVLNSVINFKRR